MLTRAFGLRVLVLLSRVLAPWLVRNGALDVVEIPVVLSITSFWLEMADCWIDVWAS